MKYEIAILATFFESGTANSGFTNSLDPRSSWRLYAAFLSDCIRKALLIVEKPIVFANEFSLGLKPAVETALGISGVVEWRRTGQNALADATGAISRPCLVIRGDCPTLPVDYLTQASHHVTHDAVVLGPAIDGGFYLLGLRSAAPSLFEGLDSGASDLFIRLRERAAQFDLSTRLLPPWYRVITADELRRLELELDTLPANSNDDCPYTRAVLADLSR